MDIILKRPIISEKSTQQVKDNLYTFLVDRKARKPVIARQVEEQFGVDVISVKTVSIKAGLKQQRGRRGFFVVPGFKKALVQLKKGQKIAIFEAEAKVEKAEDSGEKEGKKVKEKKSLLRGTKVKIEKTEKKETADKKKQTTKSKGVK